MKIQDYKWIVQNCSLITNEIDGRQLVGIFPKYKRQEDKLEQILDTEQFEWGYPTIEEFMTLSKEMAPLMKIERQNDLVKQKRVLQTLDRLSTQELADLPQKQKIDLLDKSIIKLYSGKDLDNFEKNSDAIAKYSEQFKILLFHLKFDQKFLDEEIALNDRFNNLLKHIPNLKENLESFRDLPQDKKIELAQNIIDTFNYVYNTKDIGLHTYTDKQYRQEFPTDKTPYPPTGYATNNSIHLNMDRLNKCDNMVIVSLVYHELIHIHQKERSYQQFLDMEKLMDDKFTIFNNDKKDCYVLSFNEQHAYNMDRRTIEFLKNEMNINFIDNTYSQNERNFIKDINNKAHAAFDWKLAHQTKTR